MSDTAKERLHLAAKAIKASIEAAGVVDASPHEKFFDWLAAHFCSEERPGANIGPDVVNEFIDMVDRAVDDTA